MSNRTTGAGWNLAATTFIAIMTSAGCGMRDEPTDYVGTIGATRAALTPSVAASIFNHSGLRHSDGGTGIPVDHTRDTKPIKTYDSSHAALGDVSINDGPDHKAIHIQTLEEVDLDGQRLFRVWAGGTSNDGWVESSDVAINTAHGPTPGSLVLLEEPHARAGNGESCEAHGVPFLTDSSGQPVKYIIAPATVEPPSSRGLVWKLESSTGAWYEFSPAWDKPAAPSPVPNRAFLFWSWTPTDTAGNNNPIFAGGGVVRTEMRAGEVFTPCQVEPVHTVLREVASATGSGPAPSAHHMTVFAAYGKFTDRRMQSFYGWTIYASSLNATGDCKMHVRCDGGAAKCPTLPVPSTLCHF